MNLENYWLFKEIFLRFSYILGICRDYILWISSCPINEVKVVKLTIIALLILTQFISKLIQSGKNMVAFGSTVQKSHWFFDLE